MTAHEFLVEFYAISPELLATIIICGFVTFLLHIVDGLMYLIFGFREFFKPRECVVLVENADGTFSLRVEKIKPAFHRVAKIYHDKKKR